MSGKGCRDPILNRSGGQNPHMSEINNEHERLLKQEAYKKKQIDFYRKNGRWPEDSEISEAPTTTTAARIQNDDFERLFQPRD